MYNGVGDPGLSQILDKRLMLPGGAAAPAVAPELFPCVVLESDRPEYQFLANQGRYGRGTSVGAGGAGTRATAALYNPSDSNTLVVIERITAAAASGLLVFAIQNVGAAAPFGTAAKGRSTDSRSQASTGDVRLSAASLIPDNTLAAPGAGTFMVGPLAFDDQIPVILAPGSVCYVYPNADNVAITYCTFQWRERRLNPSERI